MAITDPSFPAGPRTHGVLSIEQLRALTPKPNAIEQACSGPLGHLWQERILSEWANFKLFNVFGPPLTKAQLPPGVHITKIMQIYRLKIDEPKALSDVTLEECKVREAVRGDQMIEGLEYSDTFALVLRPESFRVILSVAVQRGFPLYQADYTSAFKQPLMDKILYVQLPKGYCPYTGGMRAFDAPPLFARLMAGLEGIPQGSHLWFKLLSARLVALGYIASVNDPCLFIHTSNNSLIGVYVDDLILAAPSHAYATMIFDKNHLAQGLTLGKWSPLRNFLRMTYHIVWTDTERSVHVSQPMHSRTALERYGLADCNAAKAAGQHKFVWTKRDCPTVEEKHLLASEGLTSDLYRQVVMSTNYIAVHTRPDLKFVQGKLAKYCANPGRLHFSALKHFLRYIAGTIGHGLLFKWTSVADPECSKRELVAWSDSSHQDCPDTSRSTLAYLVQYNGNTLSYYSKLGNTVDACINHSELHACLLCIKEVVWLRNLLAEVTATDLPAPATPLFVDNTGVESMMKNAIQHHANKIIRKAMHAGKEFCDRGDVLISRTPGDVNPSNALTKMEPSTAWPQQNADLGVSAAPVTSKASPYACSATTVADNVFATVSAQAVANGIQSHSDSAASASALGTLDIEALD